MTPERADVEPLKLQVEALETRLREQQRSSAIAFVLGWALYVALPHLPWAGAWLAGFDRADAWVMRLVIAMALAGSAHALVVSGRSKQARERLRSAREQIFLSITPSNIR